MDSRLIAKVRVPKTNGKHEIGTAYPIAKDLLLTARHVVDIKDRDSTKPIQVHWSDHNESTDKTSVIYTGEGEIDIALIQCDVSAKMMLKIPSRNPLCHLDFVDGMQWKSMGFPIVGKEGDKHFKVSAMGEFFPHDKNRAVIDLKSEGDPEEKEQWKGISGAPVFVDSMIKAVIVDTSKALQSRLTAVLIPYLLENSEEFKQKVGLETEVTSDFSKALELLKTNDDLKSSLLASLEKDFVKEEQLLNHLKQLTVSDLIKLVLEAKNKTPDSDKHPILGQFLHQMLPKVFDPLLSQKIKKMRQGTSEIISIPYATKVSAELLMADTDNREPLFERVDIGSTGVEGQELVPGKFMLSMPPESGSDGVQQQYRDIVYDLYTKTGRKPEQACRDIYSYLHDEIVPDYELDVSDYEEVKEDVKDRLQWKVENNQPSYYWVMSLPTNDETLKQERMELAAYIKNEFPQVSLLILSKERAIARQERRDYDNLSLILL